MNTIKFFLTAVIGVSLVIGCKKDQYIKDSGLNSETVSLSTYDYLKTNGQFDTLISLVDHFNLKDSINKAATLFAFTDYNAALFMRTANAATLDALYDTVSSKFITQYLFGTKITADELTLNPVQYINWAGTAAPSSLLKLENQQYVYLTSSAPAFIYYRIQYKSIFGVEDTEPGRPSDDPSDAVLTCQTTGLNTSSGTVIHVFANNVGLRKI